jgi:hypothetical protein
MRAKFMLQGSIYSIWTLDQEGSTGDEVKAFLLDIGRSTNGNLPQSFYAKIRLLANNQQANLTKEIRDCWDIDGANFCELKKGSWRISYAVFGAERKILLATVFSKQGMKSKKAYRRAANLFKQFRVQQVWDRSG